MAVTDQKWSALPVPYAMELPDRVPKERFYDPDFDLVRKLGQRVGFLEGRVLARSKSRSAG